MPQYLMAIDLAVSVPTVVGSLLSALASAFVLVIFAISPKNHLRHWLILNLTIAGTVYDVSQCSDS